MLVECVIPVIKKGSPLSTSGIEFSAYPENIITALGFGLYTPQILASYNYTPDFLIFNKK